MIAGGTGQVGGILARAFVKVGYQVVIVTRALRRAPCRVVEWDAKTLGAWANELENTDVVINLAGRSVNCRYTPENRRLIKESRTDSTRVIGQAIAQAAHPPRVWLQASTATIYAHRYDAPNDESTGILGGNEPNAPDTWRFSIDVATSWERALNEIETPQTRRVLLRSAMTMSPDRDGVFDVLLRLTRFGLGGPVGNGNQYVSWIHDHDFVRAVLWLIDHEELRGAVNLASPNPLPHRSFMKTLRAAWGVPFGLPATPWMAEIGAWFLQTETELVLKSRRVVPTRLVESGFQFEFPAWDAAARDLVARWRTLYADRQIPNSPGT